MRETEDRLMRYFDGELDGELDVEEQAEVERALAESPEAQALLTDFERVGVVVRALAEEKGVAADAIVDRVMARLESPAADVAATRVKPLRSRVIPLVSTLGLGLAAAAALVVFFRSHAPQPELAGTHAPPAAASQLIVAEEPTAIPASLGAPSDELDAPGTAEPGVGASIESVDFGAQNGSIFMVATGPQVTPVVWLVDGNSLRGGRMKAL